MCIYIHMYIHLLYLFICWQTFLLFPCLSYLNSIAMNIEVHVPFHIMAFSSYIPRSRIARSFGNSIFTFLSNLHIILHSEYSNWHSQQECKHSRSFFFSIPSLAFIILYFFIMAILTSIKLKRLKSYQTSFLITKS